MKKITGENALVLMGLKHCGKSSIGEIIAADLEIGFTDLDRLIMHTAQAEGYSSIRELYRTVGLKNFQEYEVNALRKLQDSKDEAAFILALGGGTVDNPAAMKIAGTFGRLIYLDVDEHVLLRRILKGGTPPFLQGTESPEELFHSLYTRRDHLYRKYADATVRLAPRPLEENCKLLYSELKERSYVR